MILKNRFLILFLNIIIVIYLLFISFLTFGQDKYNNQVWLGGAFTLDLKNKWEATGQLRSRITQDISYYKGTYFYFQTEKKIAKNFAFSTTYRLAAVDLGLYNRIGASFEFQKKLGDFKFTTRLAGQYQRRQFKGDDEQRVGVDSYLRPRIKIRYIPSRNWNFYVMVEPFLPIKENLMVDWWQNSIGFKYRLNKHITINPFFIYQPDFTKRQERVNNIFGVDLEYTIKPKEIFRR
jgi:hypothetical protein